MANDYIEIQGARAHNLKNIDVNIPRDQLVVITGLSGSGKSSLAFDTIYAEGQRRYIDTFSAYARQFLGSLERPDVDKIDGLSPVIAIEQKTTSKNPRSTVGTITEIYDFLRLLYARVADAYSFETGEKMVSYTDKQIQNLILEEFINKRIAVLAPVVKARKGHYGELFQQIAKNGYVKVRVDGEIVDLVPNMKVDRYKTHNIEIVVDRFQVAKDDAFLVRLQNSIDTSMDLGEGSLLIYDYENNQTRFFSRHLMCPTSGISYPEPEPNTFSFNSPKGACKTCQGLGVAQAVNFKKIAPNSNLSIKKGGFVPLGEYKSTWIFKQLENIGQKFGFTLDTPLKNISEEAMKIIMDGTTESFEVFSKVAGVTKSYKIEFEGIAKFIKSQYENSDSPAIKRWAEDFMDEIDCPDCNGTRLQKESLFFKINNQNIADLVQMDLMILKQWFDDLPQQLSKKQWQIGEEILKEINDRLNFLLNVGLGYLSLNRTARTLSGGEAQRIRLATQIGSQLVNVLYILDEPSIGLHQRDNEKLISSLKNLRDIGNSILVVEHDKDMIMAADHVIDIGPKAGKHGGRIISQGTPQEILSHDTETAKYLSGEKQIEVPKKRRTGNGHVLKIKGCTGNNLKNIDAEFPLGMFICVTGVSGSGKSTLINETLYPILNKHVYDAVKKPMPHQKVEGLEHIDKVIAIDQSPIGRTPRSNPATYTEVYTEIRQLYTKVLEAQIRGYKPGRFSFNVAGGRCETCEGSGLRKIDMGFLPDIFVTCEDCNGKRFNRETNEIRYKGKSIAEVLDMTIDESVDFFENIPKIFRKLKTLQDVGLGYITLGQQSTTLSGGEAQRVKLATELSKKDTGNTFYILDEPTTGLHFEDVKVLLDVLTKLTNHGNTILVIEHNLDVIKVADHVIDIGPEGGRHGGEIVAKGTPEQVAKNKKSLTGKYLKLELK
jgi:excinuclease ABC subunit A